MKLFKKFSFFFLLPLLVLLTIVWSVIYFPTATSLQEQADRNLLATADIVNSEISERINVIKSDLTVMTTYREFDEYYNYLDVGLVDQADRTAIAIQDNFVNLANLKGEYTAFRFYDMDGKGLINVIDKRRSYIAVDVSDSEWFKKALAMKEGEAYVSDVYVSSEYHEPTFTISQPVYHQGEIRGVIGIDFKVDNVFGELLHKASVGESGHAYLVGPTGEILAHHEKNFELDEGISNLHSTKRIFEGYKGIITAKDERGEVMMRKVYMPLESSNIGLVVEIPIAEVFGPVLHIRNRVLPILVVGLSLLTLAGFILIKRITTPIVELMDISNRMRTGNLDVKADVKSDDEIGELASSFNQMAADLKEYSQGLEGKVDERTKELETAFKELAGSRTALLNMLEDLRESEEQLKRAYDELKDIDKMKTNIISNVSHELKTPITIVIGVLDLAMDEDDEEARNELLSRGKTAITRQNKVVENLIEASRLVKRAYDFKLTSFVISDIISLSIKEVEPSAEKKDIKIKTSIPRDISKVWADFSAIKRVFDNLLDNAIKFTREGGEVLISAENSENFVKVSVMDTGIGISAKHLPKIFDRLYQVDSETTRTYSGTGMGLAVAKEILETNGGKLWVESEEGKGTTFHVTIPTEEIQEKK